MSFMFDYEPVFKKYDIELITDEWEIPTKAYKEVEDGATGLLLKTKDKKIKIWYVEGYEYSEHMLVHLLSHVILGHGNWDFADKQTGIKMGFKAEVEAETLASTFCSSWGIPYDEEQSDEYIVECEATLEYKYAIKLTDMDFLIIQNGLEKFEKLVYEDMNVGE